MPRFLILALSLLSLSSTHSIAAAAGDDDDGGGPTLTAYDILQSYDFPVGILPKGVTGYEIDTATGKFRAFLQGSCSFSIEGSYSLRYKSTISGQITKDKITNLSGISVKILFLWVNIIEVVRRGDDLQFSVGIASAQFSLDSFVESPQCGCGFNCNSDEQVRKVRTNHPLFSSI